MAGHVWPIKIKNRSGGEGGIEAPSENELKMFLHDVVILLL